MLTTIATRCLNELPFDILTEIFSYLSQDECLTCMDAGPAWFHLVPHYSERVWENITLLERSFVKEDPRLKQCLGNHVKFVCLRVNRNKEILYDLLDKLAEYKCDQIERISTLLFAKINWMGTTL
ncbi:hypothetical protein BDA99DRAFT_206408 [Phascolomyces articulosus]|uniref:F-box domain-containing protein n=1 Tax=Phascolomyces articulosus TaxID=60185 RepID=A0AAD5K4W8_9FUNG|nr:hypothetical protein BDA99DRAFT_206408 [Phascolomyces articulosus]